MKIYYQALKIYYLTLKIYYQGVKIISNLVSKNYIPNIKELCT